MVVKDTTKFEEICSLCKHYIPKGRLVLRQEETQNIICVLCLAEIAEVPIS